MSAQRPHPRQYVRFCFYVLESSWRALGDEERSHARKELTEVLLAARERLPVARTYSTVGTRGDSDFCVWTVARSLEDIGVLESAIRDTAMGRHVRIAHSYLAMTRRSQYEDRLGDRREKLRVKPGRAAYLFVYPFVKTRAWYALPLSERQAMMDAHIEAGHRYPTVKLNTTYSFGLDDQDFVVAFETDRPDDFQDLVMELRETRASIYTERDTPIFTCIAGEPEAVLGSCG